RSRKFILRSGLYRTMMEVASPSFRGYGAEDAGTGGCCPVAHWPVDPVDPPRRIGVKKVGQGLNEVEADLCVSCGSCQDGVRCARSAAWKCSSFSNEYRPTRDLRPLNRGIVEPLSLLFSR